MFTNELRLLHEQCYFYSLYEFAELPSASVLDFSNVIDPVQFINPQGDAIGFKWLIQINEFMLQNCKDDIYLQEVYTATDTCRTVWACKSKTDAKMLAEWMEQNYDQYMQLDFYEQVRLFLPFEHAKELLTQGKCSDLPRGKVPVELKAYDEDAIVDSRALSFYRWLQKNCKSPVWRWDESFYCADLKEATLLKVFKEGLHERETAKSSEATAED